MTKDEIAARVRAARAASVNAVLAALDSPDSDEAELIDSISFEDDPLHAAALVAAGAGELSLCALRLTHDSMDEADLNAHRAALRAAAVKAAAAALRMVIDIDRYNAF